MLGQNISKRLLKLAANVVRMSRQLPEDAAGRHVMRQIVRAATGGGANYEEARGAESRADFVHKAAVAAKEMRETLYWLRLIEEAGLLEASVERLIAEANELVAILTSSVHTARRRGEASGPAQTKSTRRPGAREPGSFYLCAPSE